jgi:predicted RNA-binding protein with RPS1 domain
MSTNQPDAPSALEVAVHVDRTRARLPRQLPFLPASVTSDAIPHTPPEELARITKAKSDRAVLDRVYATARSGAWDAAVLQPLIQLANNLAKENRQLKAKVAVLEIDLECKLNLSMDTRHELITIYEVHPEQAGRPTREQFESLQAELETTKADLEKRNNELVQKQAELDRRTPEEQVPDISVQLEKSRRTILDIKEDHKREDARREIMARHSMYDQIQLGRRNARLWKETSILESQLEAAHKKVKQSTALFHILANNVQYMEELFKSYVWYANTDRNQTERDYARLQRQNEKQTRKYERLHADAVEDLRYQTTTSEEIRMYKWAWSETMRFIYHLLGLDTEDMTDDPSESVLDITQRRLRQCQVVKYEIDKTQKECMDKYEAVCERWKNSKECFQQLNEAMVMIKSLTSDVSKYKTVAMTQEARYQATLRQRNMFALALRDTKSQFNRLLTITQGAAGST